LKYKPAKILKLAAKKPWTLTKKLHSIDTFLAFYPKHFDLKSEKLGKKAKSLKIFFSRTVSAMGEQKPFLESLRGPFSSLFEATSCDRYFSDYASESAKV
jgi:hypothetical protein